MDRKRKGVDLIYYSKVLTAGGALILCALLILFVVQGSLFAHGEEKHPEGIEAETQAVNPVSPEHSGSSQKSAVGEQNSQVNAESGPIHPLTGETQEEVKKRKPNFHPLVVHFPVVLLMIAPLLYLLAILLKKRDYKVLTSLILLVSLVFSILAVTVFHPHTTGLPAPVEQILEKHELYAGISIWVSLAALILTALSCKKRFSVKLFEVLTLALLIASFLAVGMAGHYGGVLTHTHGVGAKGMYLEDH